MKTMVDYCPTPSSAIRAMVNGLRNQSNRKDFVIDMGYYGLEKGGLCFGCAATCAVQEAAKVNFTVVNIYVGQQCETLDVDFEELNHFEGMLNSLRMGRWDHLIEYYDRKDLLDKLSNVHLPAMENVTWRQCLVYYEELAERLEKLGA